VSGQCSRQDESPLRQQRPQRAKFAALIAHGSIAPHRARQQVGGLRATSCEQRRITAYGTLEILTAFEQAGIHAYMPLPNWKDQYAVWSASHFQHEPEADQYRCPQGTILQRIGELDLATGRQLYRAPAAVCNACPVKAHCTTSDQGRRLSRHVGEEYRERVHAYQQTPA
jgi:hypothetical protein